MTLHFNKDRALPVLAAAWLVAIYGSTVVVWGVTILLLRDPLLLAPGLWYAKLTICKLLLWFGGSDVTARQC